MRCGCGGTLGGSTTATTNASGVATFANLSITGVVGNYTLTFTAGTLTSITSAPVAVAAGAATQLTVTTQPSASITSAVVFVQQPVVQLRDAAGNAWRQRGRRDHSVAWRGQRRARRNRDCNDKCIGLATFTNLSITGVAGSKLLNFTSPGLTTAASAAFNLTAGAATQLFLATQPSASVVSAVTFAQQPVVQLADVSSNFVSQSGIVVTSAIASGVATLGGTLTATTNTNGAATFTGLAVTGAAGNTTLGFSSPGLAGVTSGTIAIAPPALPSLAGTWAGSWTDLRYGVTGTITNVILTQSATAFGGTGTIDLTQLSLGTQSGTATGTISGSTVTFNFTAAGIGSGSGTLAGNAGTGTGNITALNFGAFTFTGTASSTQITGTFQFTSPTGGNGTITVTKQ